MCVCSATSNVTHAQLGQPTHYVSTPSSHETFIHDSVRSVLSNSIFNLHIQFVTNYVSDHPYHEYVLVKPLFGLPRRLLHPDYQIDAMLMISDFTDLGDTTNLLCTPRYVLCTCLFTRFDTTTCVSQHFPTRLR